MRIYPFVLKWIGRPGATALTVLCRARDYAALEERKKMVAEIAEISEQARGFALPFVTSAGSGSQHKRLHV